MISVQSALIAARQLALAILAGALVTGIALAHQPAKSSKKKPPVAVSRRAVISHRSKSAAPASNHTRRAVTSHSESEGSARVRTRRVIVTRKKVHGRWVRTTQIVRAEPKPSFQTHPETDRYQQIQQALASSGYFKGQVNGAWGDDSIDAMKRFQNDHKLPNDGKISSLSLIDLGLGPDRDSAASLPLAPLTPQADPPVPTAHN
jgi:hypothetical protein